MTATAVSVAGFVALFAAGIALELAGRTGSSGVPAGRALAAAMRSGPGRTAVFVWWIWLGVHFLAR